MIRWILKCKIVRLSKLLPNRFSRRIRVLEIVNNRFQNIEWKNKDWVCESDCILYPCLNPKFTLSEQPGELVSIGGFGELRADKKYYDVFISLFSLTIYTEEELTIIFKQLKKLVPYGIAIAVINLGNKARLIDEEIKIGWPFHKVKYYLFGFIKFYHFV